MAITKIVRKTGVIYRVLVWDKFTNRLKHVGMYKTRAEAKRVEALAVERVRSTPLAENVTMKRLVDEWSATLRVSERTKSSYMGQVRLIQMQFGDDRKVRTIAPAECEDFINALVERKLSPLYIRNTVARMSSLFRRALSRRYIERSPLEDADISMPRGGRKREPHILTPEEHKRLVEAAPPRYKAMFAIWPHVGLRVGEMLGLKPTDIDVEQKVLRVERQQDGGKEIPLKTKESRRRVLLADSTLDILQAHIKEFVHGDWLFADNGDPLTVSVFSHRIWTPTCTTAGLPDLHTHDCRHTAGAWWAYKGGSLLYLKHQLGHSTIATTANVYGALYDEFDRTVVERVSEWTSEENSVGKNGD